MLETAVNMAELCPPKEMCFSSSNTAEAWRKWELAFKTYYAAAELSKKDAKTQVAILLHSAGLEAQEIFSNFVFGDEESKDNVDDVLQKFKFYCEPKRNEIFATYKFWNRNRIAGENFEKWFNDLKTLAADCNFQDQRDRHIRDKIVLSLDDHLLRERLIERGNNLTLEKCIEVCRTAETSKARSQAMNTSTKSNVMNVVKASGDSHCNQNAGTKQNFSVSRVLRNCRYCGKQHEPRKCPAYGKKCKFCNKFNHFSSVCKSRLSSPSTSMRQIRDIQADFEDEEDDEFLHISAIQQDGLSTKTKTQIMMLNVNDEQCPIMCKLDTGAEANVMSKGVYDILGLN